VAWARIAPLLPGNGRRGKQWRDHRTVINAIVWKRRTGAPWRDLPERYGPWRTAYDRFVRWRRDGTWERLLADARTKSDAVGAVVWEVSIASSHVRAHQHGARRPHRSATVGRPARGSRLVGARVGPGGQAVTRADPTGAPSGAPRRRILL
jgi:transposase